jgi:hypothetical protein
MAGFSSFLIVINLLYFANSNRIQSDTIVGCLRRGY